MERSRRLAAALAAAVLLTGGAAVAAETAGAVTTPGSGTLTKCRDWLVFESCSTYHHVALPRRIAVGDRIDVAFGSNLKQFTFRVVRVRRRGDRCTLFDADRGENGDRIEVAPCRAPLRPAAAR